MKLEKMSSLFLCQYPLKQGVANLRPADPIRSSKYLRTPSVPPNTCGPHPFLQIPADPIRCYCTAIHFNNLLLNRLRKSHCIRSSNGQEVVHSALGSKRLATPELKCSYIYCSHNDFSESDPEFLTVSQVVKWHIFEL